MPMPLSCMYAPLIKVNHYPKSLHWQFVSVNILDLSIFATERDRALKPTSCVKFIQYATDMTLFIYFFCGLWDATHLLKP